MSAIVNGRQNITVQPDYYKASLLPIQNYNFTVFWRQMHRFRRANLVMFHAEVRNPWILNVLIIQVLELVAT